MVEENIRWRRTAHPHPGCNPGGWTLWLTLLLFVISCTPVHAQELRAYLDRNPVRIGETVRLIIEFDGAVDARGFDASLLERDFEVLGSSSSSRINIVDGRQQSSSQLIVELAPRREGRITIPTLNLARGNTAPVALRVLEADDAAGGEVFLEIDVDTTTPYVQAPVNLVVKLFHGIPLLEGTIADPQAEGALVRRFGEDVQYTAVRDGVRYRVIERHFVLFPQRSGEIAIPPLTFDGRVAAGEGGTMSGLFRQGRRVRVRSEPVQLEVRAPPVSAGADWLPARNVVLTESWPDEPPEFIVGQPVTRTLRVEAEGISGEQIPELAPAEVDGIRHYPDKPELHTTVRGNSLFGVSERRIAMVPSRAGSFILPAVELEWWDTADDRMRVARLPARTISILPDPSMESAMVRSDPVPSSSPGLPLVREVGFERHWRWIAILFATLWLATLSLWWRDRALSGSAVAVGRGVDASRPRLSSLRAACRGGDPRRIRDALLAWARKRWPEAPPRGLDALAVRLGDPSLGEQFSMLDAACYDADAKSLDGAGLWALLEARLRRQDVRLEASGALPPLYPVSDAMKARRAHVRQV